MACQQAKFIDAAELARFIAQLVQLGTDFDCVQTAAEEWVVDLSQEKRGPAPKIRFVNSKSLKKRKKPQNKKIQKRLKFRVDIGRYIQYTNSITS